MLTQKPQNIRKNNIQYAFIALIFLLFTLFNTYPLIKHITTHQLGDGRDGPGFMWNLWWVKKSLFSLQNPYYTNYLFYPNGTNLYLHTLTPFNSLISIPLQFLFNGNLILTYNIIVIINFILAGLSMFILAFYLTKNKFASIVAGYVFTFNPYMIGHSLGHLNLISVWPIPLFILYFIKFHENTSFKNMLFSSLFLILSTLYCMHHGIFILIFSFLYSSFYLITKKFKVNRNFILKLFGIFIIYFLILSPIFYGVVTSILSKNYAGNHDPNFWSPDIATFFVPGNLLKSKIFFNNFGWWVMNISYNGAENQNFLGYTILILSVITIIMTFNKKIENKKIDYYVKFWLIFAIVGFIFALGTKLKFFGYVSNVKLPYYYVYKIIPLVSVPGRFALLVFISLAMLSAIGLTNLSEKLSTKKKYLLYAIIFILIIFEFLAIPYKLTSYKVPEFYYTLSKEKEDFAIHDLSQRDDKGYIAASGFHMYYQTIHNKKITDGRISRNNLAALNYAKNLPVSDLEKLNIKYVICSKNSKLCENFQVYPIIYQDKDIGAYKTK